MPIKKKAKQAPRRKAPVRKKPPRKKPMTVDPRADPLRTRILDTIRRIPRGQVCTYGDVADVAGLPRRARLVGTILRQTPGTKDLPWFRVINAGGRISFPTGSDAYNRQRRKLEAEGVDFVGGRVDLERYGWPPREEQLDELLWKPR